VCSVFLLSSSLDFSVASPVPVCVDEAMQYRKTKTADQKILSILALLQTRPDETRVILRCPIRFILRLDKMCVASDSTHRFFLRAR